MPWKKVGKTGDVSSLNELVYDKNQATVECFAFFLQVLGHRMNLSCLFWKFFLEQIDKEGKEKELEKIT